MFGRVRASPSPSPLDSVDSPRTKILKDDSLSIYEVTLMKLKKGSQRHLISPLTEGETDSATETIPETTSDIGSDAMNVEATCCSGTAISKSCRDISSDEEVIMTDTDSSYSSDRQPTGNLNLQQGESKSMSILYMFSGFKGYQRAPAVTREAMMVGNDVSASFSSSSDTQSLSIVKELGNQESSNCSSFFGLC